MDREILIFNDATWNIYCYNEIYFNIKEIYAFIIWIIYGLLNNLVISFWLLQFNFKRDMIVLCTEFKIKLFSLDNTS